MIAVIKHAPHEGLGTFEGTCRELAPASGIRVIDATSAGARDWELARGVDVLFVMGGAMGVYEADQYPFLGEELRLLRDRIKRDAPTMGICLGSQLVAEAAGSTVRSSGRREIGWFPVTPTADAKADRVVGGLNWTQPVFHWHGDSWDKTPEGAVHLLVSERFQQQGFRLGQRVYGFQFHPEVPERDLPEWLACEPELPYGKIDGIASRSEILAGGRRYAGAMAVLSGELIRRFLAVSGLIS